LNWKPFKQTLAFQAVPINKLLSLRDSFPAKANKVQALLPRSRQRNW